MSNALFIFGAVILAALSFSLIYFIVCLLSFRRIGREIDDEN